MRVALVNTNRSKPPIAPIGLDYVAEALSAAGHGVDFLDLCWPDDWRAAVVRFFAAVDYDLVGVSLRNTDDCMFAGRQSFLDDFAAMVSVVHRKTDAPIVLGGVGFSVMPAQVLSCCAADFGIWGEGEFAFPKLADRLENGQGCDDLPNLIWQRNSRWCRNLPVFPSLEALPPMRRLWVDNPRYFREGGQAGFETKRGCACACTYCADPLSKGTRIRLRPPAAVADEVEALLSRGIDHLHTCDSEFNIPLHHADAVCREFIRRDLGSRLRWYAYCAPAPFSAELARSMRAAGCAGINFGADSGDAEMLVRLQRDFTPDDIADATRWCREAGLAVMLDLLLGAPGESEASLRRTIDLMQRLRPDRVGVSLGVRVYPGTLLAREVKRGELSAGLVGADDPSELLYFIEPAVAPFASSLLENLIGDDPRFFFAPAGPDRGYNYSGNQPLVDAIRAGYRGAYWDILRRCAEEGSERME